MSEEEASEPCQADTSTVEATSVLKNAMLDGKYFQIVTQIPNGKIEAECQLCTNKKISTLVYIMNSGLDMANGRIQTAKLDNSLIPKSQYRYNSLVTARRAKGIIAVCWVLSVGIGLTPMLGWNMGVNATNSSSCPEGMTECLFEGVVTLDYMVYFNFFGCVLVPLLAMLAIYARIFMAARRQLRLMDLKLVHMHAPGAGSSSTSSRTTLQKEVHAAKSLAIIVGLFALCWLPVHIINCFNLFCQDCGRPHIWVMNIAIILSHANSVVNPFIYAYRIREFRHTFRRILQQHMLGHKEGHGAGEGGGRGLGRSSSIMRASSNISMVDSSCGTMVNSYALEPSPELSPTRNPIDTHRAGKEAYSASCQWSPPPSDPAPISSIENGLYKGDAPASPKPQQCIMGCAVQRGVETTTELMEVKDSGNISFVHIRPLSPTLTSPNHTVELTKVS